MADGKPGNADGAMVPGLWHHIDGCTWARRQKVAREKNVAPQGTRKQGTRGEILRGKNVVRIWTAAETGSSRRDWDWKERFGRVWGPWNALNTCEGQGHGGGGEGSMENKEEETWVKCDGLAEDG